MSKKAMGRDSYDDMVSPSRSGRGRKRGGSKAGIIAALGIVICLLAVIVYIFVSPPKEESVSREKQQQINVEVKKIEDVTPEVKTEVPVTATNTVTPTVTKIEEVQSTTPLEVNSVSVAPTKVSTPTTTARDLSSALNTSTSTGAVKFVSHTVSEGEDLASIAAMYGLKTETLISVNKIKNIAAIVPGTVLSIPDRNGRYYTVQEGDMLSTIVHKFNPELGWKKLQEINGLKSENIKVGQELFIPDVEEDNSSVVSVSALTFTKPVDGSITANFGQRVDGQALSGIYMTASAGSAVKAVQKGAVIDAGNDSALGRFVIILHDEGYKSYYYYLETVTVKVGSEVVQGDVIGSIGTSNQKFTRPTLYFKLEQNGIALDPGFFF